MLGIVFFIYRGSFHNGFLLLYAGRIFIYRGSGHNRFLFYMLGVPFLFIYSGSFTMGVLLNYWVCLCPLWAISSYWGHFVSFSFLGGHFVLGWGILFISYFHLIYKLPCAFLFTVCILCARLFVAYLLCSAPCVFALAFPWVWP